VKPDLRIRPLQDGDIGAVVTLYDDATTRDANIGPITNEQWTSFVRRPQNHHGRDFRVALHDGQLVGLAESSPRDQDGQRVRFFKLLVQPSKRRQGIGTALLAELLALDAPADDLSFQAVAASAWTDGIAFLEASGFSHIESEISMSCSSLRASTQSPTIKVSVERVETPALYAEVVARIHNAAFATDVAFRAYHASEMADLLAGDGQELWIISDVSRVVGYCRFESEPKQIWLEEIAIDPSDQGKGLGTALAYRALQTIGVDQGRAASLSVSSVNRAALAMYQQLGFIIRNEKRRYSAQQMNLNARIREK
jgi:mycothiol synthase